MKEVVIYTDGSCLGNPGTGGWAAILRYKDYEKEIFGGFIHTTNNRMELMAVIRALQQLKKATVVTVYTDSKYIRDALEEGWLRKWQKNNWKTSNKKDVKNKDLWLQLLHEITRHTVQFQWIKAHNGIAENERCDALAKQGATHPQQEIDVGFTD